MSAGPPLAPAALPAARNTHPARGSATSAARRWRRARRAPLRPRTARRRHRRRSRRPPPSCASSRCSSWTSSATRRSRSRATPRTCASSSGATSTPRGPSSAATAATIEKFIGDAVMAVWGAPIAREDDAERAVRAGLELVDAVAAFGEEVGAPELRARAGVVTGQVASLASPGEGLVVGDRVNTASRVQSAAAPGTVLRRRGHPAGDLRRHRLRGRRRARGQGQGRAAAAVAGGAGRRRAWRAPSASEGLRGPASWAATPSCGWSRSSSTPGVDRGAARLVARLRAGGRRQDAAAVGVREVHRRAGATRSSGTRAAASPTATASPYWALAEMVRQRLGIAEEAAPEEAAREARSRAGALGRRRRRARVPRAAAGRAARAVDRAREPRRARSCSRAGGCSSSAWPTHEPVVLVFEDMQWADDGLLDFIEHLLDWSAAAPDLHPRASPGPSWPSAGRAGRRRAPARTLALPRAARRRAMRRRCSTRSSTGCPADARDRIVAQAEGMPLYALETVRALADRGVARPSATATPRAGRRDRRPRRPGEPELAAGRAARRARARRARAGQGPCRSWAGAFPRGRCGALSGDARASGSTACWPGWCASRCWPSAPTRSRPTAGSTPSRRRCCARSPTTCCRAASARPATSRPPRTCARPSRTTARRSPRSSPPTTWTPTARRARTPTPTSCAREALAALRRAAQRAARVGAPEAAERAYRTALELAADERERTELTEAAGRWPCRPGATSDGLTLLEAAARAHGRRRAARARRRGWRCHVGEALAARGPGTGRASSGCARRWRCSARRRLDPRSGALNSALGDAAGLRRRPEEAGSVSRARLATCGGAGAAPRSLPTGSSPAGICHIMTGRPEEAIACTEGAIGVAEAHGFGYAEMRAQNNSGDLRANWDLPEAAERFEAAIATARRIGNRSDESLAAGNLMLLDLYAGRWSQVEPLAGELLGEPGGAAPRRRLHLRATGSSARPARRARGGRREPGADRRLGARRRLRAAGRVRRAGGGGRTARGAGRTGAGACVARRQPVHRRQRTRERKLPPGVALGLRSRPCGRAPGGGRRARGAHRRPAAGADPALPRRAGRARPGARRGGQGGDRKRRERPPAAVDTLRSLGYPYWLARAQTELAAWLIDQGQMAEAAPLLDEAIATLERLGAEPALRRARALADAGVAAEPRA